MKNKQTDKQTNRQTDRQIYNAEQIYIYRDWPRSRFDCKFQALTLIKNWEKIKIERI